MDVYAAIVISPGPTLRARKKEERVNKENEVRLIKLILVSTVWIVIDPIAEERLFFAVRAAMTANMTRLLMTGKTL